MKTFVWATGGLVRRSSQGATVDETPRRHLSSGKALFRAAALVAAAVVLVFGIVVYRNWRFAREKEYARADLQSVLEEIDRAEPEGWDFDALERGRAVVPEEQNAAETARRAWSALPPDWQSRAELPEINLHAPGSVVSANHSVSLRQEDADQIKRELDKVRPAVAEARKLLDFKTGRFPTPEITADFFLHGSKAHYEGLLLLERLLAYEAIAQAHDRNTGSAWLAALAVLHVGRAIGDEAGLHSQTLRMTCPGRADALLQRVLGQGEVEDALLVRAAQLFDDELAYPAEERWLRAERAAQHHFYTNLATGALDPEKALPKFRWEGEFQDPERRLAMIQRSHAYVLRYLTKAIECTRQAQAECKRCMGDLDQGHKQNIVDEKAPALAQVLTPGILRIAGWERRTRMNCLQIALAAERYRLKQRRWPERMDDLVADGFLKAPPVDFILNQPIQFRSAPDGIVIFSPGVGRYEGDALDDVAPAFRSYTPPEFRLWSPEHRRRDPPPKPGE
jgi:hypothetical protein